MEIALYVRVSTTRQHQAQTIEQQLDRLQAHVAHHPDWHLADEHIYRDDGYSGAKLNRPGLDRLRDRAAFAAFELVLVTAPDRLARNYVHQMLLIDELAQRGCQVVFVDRPMSDDPHDQLLLQIRGAVAEYERTLIADRMRRGRQAKLHTGQLLPWTRAPYGYILDPERPRDPSRVRLDPVKAVIVQQIFAWYTDPQTAASLYMVAKRLSDEHIPTPTGSPRWNVASIRGILRSPTYIGLAYSGRTRPVVARRRKSALQKVGPGHSQRKAPTEEWVAIPVPAIISQESFDLAQARLDQNKQMARRNNTAHEYLLRGLVSCGACKLACRGRCLHSGYDYYVCRGRTEALRAAKGERCIARYIPASALDDVVWQDLCQVLAEPSLITHELERAQMGEWLPQALQARRKTLQDALTQLERQQTRLLDAYLAEIIGRDEFERKREQVQQTHNGLSQQLRQVDAQAQRQLDVAKVAEGITNFCQRIRPTLKRLDFAQRRQLVELLIDCVIVTDGQVEIRYVVPTGPAGETTAFCHLRKDYFDLRAGQERHGRSHCLASPWNGHTSIEAIGAELLCRQRGLECADIAVERVRSRSLQNLEHSVAIGRVYAALRAAAEYHSAVTLSGWQGDHSPRPIRTQPQAAGCWFGGVPARPDRGLAGATQRVRRVAAHARPAAAHALGAARSPGRLGYTEQLEMAAQRCPDTTPLAWCAK
jgi:site-specific DNA recombinase